MADYLDICEQAARSGGLVLLDWLGRNNPREKGPKDLVTEADLASQRVIQEIVLGAFPDHLFLGEEEDDPSAEALRGHSGYRWIVDPLDGTTNYVHGLPNFSVSVALEHQGELLCGAIHDPVANECFTAQLRGGAFLNGKQVRVSECETLREALVATSFPANVTRDSPEICRFVEALVECQAVRRLGSAALNLAYLAAGRLDAYWATSVQPWDVAAGVLIVREAGGLVTGPDGDAFRLAQPKFVAAATQPLHVALINTLNRATN